MATKASVQKVFKKYTVQPTGIWARVASFFQIDANRSTGVPLNPYFRNPPPGGNDPKEYDDPVTIPAGDLANNPYWKRDVRRTYPKLSVVNQGDVVGLLTVGNKSAPNEEVLQIGDAGTKQLVEIKEQSEKGLPAFFEKDKTKIGSVLGPDGLPPMPTNLGQNTINKKLQQYELTDEQAYGPKYPCRSWA